MNAKLTKKLAWIMVLCILFQSCIVYQKNSVSIDEAIETEGKEAKSFKIITEDERTLIFESIYIREGEYYGLMIVEKVPYPVETRIYPESIKEIHLYDPKKSRNSIITGSSAIMVVLGLLVVVGLVAVIIWFFSFGWLEGN